LPNKRRGFILGFIEKSCGLRELAIFLAADCADYLDFTRLKFAPFCPQKDLVLQDSRVKKKSDTNFTNDSTEKSADFADFTDFYSTEICENS